MLKENVTSYKRYFTLFINITQKGTIQTSRVFSSCFEVSCRRFPVKRQIRRVRPGGRTDSICSNAIVTHSTPAGAYKCSIHYGESETIINTSPPHSSPLEALIVRRCELILRPAKIADRMLPTRPTQLCVT